MPNSYNFTGRLGADAEIRTTQSGEKVLSMRVAVDTGFGDRRHTDWLDVSLWGKRGEAVVARLTKGVEIWGEGELKQESFQKRDGTQDKKLALRMNNFQIFGGKGEAGGGSAGGGVEYDQSPVNKPAAARNNKPPQNQKYDDMADEEIPF